MEERFTDEEILVNKDEFIKLVMSISRDGFKTETILDKLENSDWYYAPASTKYHGSYKGGLVDHSLAVYYNLCRILENKGIDKYDEDTVKIVALFHDISKMNLYERGVQNKKVYSEGGSKYDEIGKYDWVSVPTYKVREDAFSLGSHEQTSEYMLRKFTPLKLYETEAILHHHGGMAWDSSKADISPIYGKNELACALHLADMIATYIDKA